jgi:nucleoside transporter
MAAPTTGRGDSFGAPKPQATSPWLKSRLAGMMFLQYVIWGSWYVTINTYLTRTLHFTATEAAMVFGTVSIASLVSPVFVGLVADRFFATERVMSVLYGLSAVCIFAVTRVQSFWAVFGLMLLFCLCYFPTVSLTNSLTMQQVKDPGRDFPPIRTMGALGWIVINLVIGFMRVEAGTTPFVLAGIAALLMAAYSLVALPHTPPPARGLPVTLGRVLGLDAIAMLRSRTFAVFAVASVLACIPLTFYYSFTNPYLNDVGVVNAAGKMSLGQVSELGMMLAMPLIFRVASVRAILLGGLAAWAARYVLLAYGNADAGMWMFYIAIILHGVCYDFFFVTGQLYTDQEAPPHLRSTAQGFITFITYGVGMLIGSLLSGGALDHFTHTVGGEVVRDWRTFWLSSATMSAVIGAFVLVWFRTPVRMRPQDRSPALETVQTPAAPV